MGIFSRMTDIINANLNAMLEKAEDPEKIVRLMIQEMEDTLVEVRSNAARAIADKKERVRQKKWLEKTQSDWEEKAELAVRKDREDLARAALSEKARNADQIEGLDKELEVVEANLSALNGDIAKLEAKLKDAKSRQRSMTMRHSTAKSQLKMRRQIHDPRIDDVLLRFENAERKIDEAESRVEAYDLGRKKGLRDEFVDLESDERVTEELAALKKKVGGEQ